jgi:hypothetical protein
MFSKKKLAGSLAALGIAATAAVTGGVVAASDADAAVTKRVVFKTWGVPERGLVEVSGKTTIERMRYLPYRTTQYLSGFDLDWASVTVEDPRGYRKVGCSITVNGVVKARDVSTYGFAWCSLL